MLAAMAALPVLAAEAEPAPIPVNLKVGQQTTVLLDGNPTTGYMWRLAASKTNNIVVSAELTCPAQENSGFCCGFPTPTTLTLVALSPGKKVVPLSITNSQSLLKLTSIESVMPSNHLLLCHPLLPPSIFPSIRVFSNKSVIGIRWPKYWSFSFSISPSNEYSGLISFRIDWLDLLAVQGTLKSLLQHHSSKASVLRHLTFFTIQLSHP